MISFDSMALRIAGAESDIADRVMSDLSVIEGRVRIINTGETTRSGAIDLYGIELADSG